MKQYYLKRLRWMFRYTSNNALYIILKTLCLAVGIPVAAVLFVAEMATTLVNMLFSFIPLLNIVVLAVCKVIAAVCQSGFYIAILPDIKNILPNVKRKERRKRKSRKKRNKPTETSTIPFATIPTPTCLRTAKTIQTIKNRCALTLIEAHLSFVDRNPQIFTFISVIHTLFDIKWQNTTKL